MSVIEQILYALKDLLDKSNIFKDLLRDLGWDIIMFVKMAVDGLENVITKTYEVVTTAIPQVLNKFMPYGNLIASAVVVVAICILGYKLMFKRDSKSNHFTGILLTLVISMGMPVIFSAGLEIFKVSSSPDEIGTSLTNQVITSNLTDLGLYAKNENFGVVNNQPPGRIEPKIGTENMKYIDINELLDKDMDGYSSLPTTSKDLLKQELTINADGAIGKKDFNKSIFSRDGYYRFKINWFGTFATMIIIALTLFIMTVKVVKILFQLVMDRVVGTILMFADLEEGNRAKELLKHIIATFAMLLVSLMSMSIYISLVGNVLTSSADQGILTRSFIIIFTLLGSSLALVEGTSIIEKLMGTRVDSGLVRTGAGLYGMKKLGTEVGGLAKGGVSLGKSLAKGGMAVGKTAGMPIKYASDKTGLSDKLSDKGGQKVGNFVGGIKEKGQSIKNGVDSGLEKVGESLGLIDSKDNIGGVDLDNSNSSTSNDVGLNNQPIQSNLSDFSSNNGNSNNDDESIGTGINNELKNARNTDVASASKTNGINAQVGNLPNKDVTQSGGATNTSGGTSNSSYNNSSGEVKTNLGQGSNSDKTLDNNQGGNLDFNQGLNNHERKKNNNQSSTNNTSNRKGRGKYQL